MLLCCPTGAARVGWAAGGSGRTGAGRRAAASGARGGRRAGGQAAEPPRGAERERPSTAGGSARPALAARLQRRQLRRAARLSTHRKAWVDTHSGSERRGSAREPAMLSSGRGA